MGSSGQRRRSAARAASRPPPRRRAAGFALGAARVATIALLWQLGVALAAPDDASSAAVRAPGGNLRASRAHPVMALYRTGVEDGKQHFLREEGGEEGKGKKGEKDKEVNMSASMSISIMLLGSIGFQMTMFYLVNWPDVDIVYYSWQVIGDTISIFTAVLFFQAVDGVVEEYIITRFEESPYEKELSFAVDYGHMLFWFTIMQMATALLSGAMGKSMCPQCITYPSQKHKDVAEEHEAHEKHEKQEKLELEKMKREGYGSSARWSPKSAEQRKAAAAAAAKKKTIEGTAVQRRDQAIQEKEKKEHDEHILHELEHYRELNLACFATMLAHMTGFAAINCMSALQHYKWFEESLFASFVAILVSFAILVCILWITDCVRRCISATDGDEEPDEWECMWDDECEEAENDVLALCCSFLISQSLRYCIYGKLPDDEGILPGHVLKDKGLTGLLLMVAMFIGFLFCTYAALQYNGWERKRCAKEKIRPGESTRLRISAIVLCITMMCFAWTGMWTARAWISRWDFFNMESILAQVVLALLASCFCFLAVFTLDKIADSDATNEGMDEAIMSIILSIGLIVGFVWEKCFDKAVEEIAEKTHSESVNQAFLKMLLATCLCIIVVPAYRMYVLPKIQQTKKVHLLEEKHKGFDNAAKNLGHGKQGETPLTSHETGPTTAPLLRSTGAQEHSVPAAAERLFPGTIPTAADQRKGSTATRARGKSGAALKKKPSARALPK